MSPIDVQLRGKAHGVAADLLQHPVRQACAAGSTIAASPECTPASSMCSMMPPMTDVVPVGDHVDVHLDGVLDEPIDQDRPLG